MSNAPACRHERRAVHGDFPPSPLWPRELDADYQDALKALPTPEPIEQDADE